VFEMMIVLYATAVGFVAAGIVSSGYQLVTAQPLKLVIGGTTASIARATVLCAVAGPLLITRALATEYAAKNRTPTILAAGTFAAIVWSCCLGILILGFSLSIIY
jgi:hypothetical protein